MNVKLILACCTLVLAACARDAADDPTRRGSAETVAELTPEQRAAVYAVALRASFDLPGTTLLIDPRMLPTAGGYETRGERMPGEVARALRRTGTVAGECIPEALRENGAPTCEAPMAGYAIRFSDVFTHGDSLRVNIVAERYRAAADPVEYHSPFRMEERYTLLPAARGWTVARKERLRL